MTAITHNRPLIIILVGTFVLYLAGVFGPFLYDDFSNLSLLQKSFLDNLAHLPQILTSGISSELGRPLSLLSFALQPTTFPDSALIYKLYNVLLHLVNGLLVYLFTKELATRLTDNDETTTRYFALISAALWLLHPLFVSTTLYVIQRMTLLSFMFSMLAMLYFIRWSPQEITSWVAAGKRYVLLGVLITAAVLSKENAVMIFPMLLVMGLMISDNSNQIYRRALLLFTLVPILLMAWKLAPYASDARYASAGYDYGALERLLTQVVVIAHYLQQIILPNLFTMSIHHDDFQLVSTLSDSRFIFAAAILLVLVMALFMTKNRLVRFGILWFMIWHLLESSFLPIMLYFEHRNYLPALGIIWIIALVLISLFQRFEDKGKVKHLFTLVPIAFLATSTAYLSFIWADQDRLIDHWQKAHPNSERTALAKFNATIAAGKLQAAEQQLQTLSEPLRNSSLPLALAHFGLNCALENQDDSVTQRVAQLSQQPANISRIIPDVHSSVTTTLIRNKAKCPEQLEQLDMISQNILAHAPQKKRRGFKAQLYANLAFLALNRSNPQKALDYFEKSYSNGRYELIVPLIDLNIQFKQPEQARKWFTEAILYEQNRGMNDPSVAEQLQMLQSRYKQILQN